MRPFAQRRRIVNRVNLIKLLFLFVASSIISAAIHDLLGRNWNGIEGLLRISLVFIMPLFVFFFLLLIVSRISDFRVSKYSVNSLVAIRLVSPLEDRSVDGALLQLEQRVKALEARAWLILVMIVLTVTATIVAILFVGQLDGGRSGGALSDMRSIIVELERDSDDIISRYRPNSLAADTFDERARMLNTHIAKVRESQAKYLSQLRPDTISSEVVSVDNLIVSAFTRLAIFGMMIFFVKILIDLYRYNVRLIAFYNSRKDALRIVEDPESAAFKKCAEVFMPKLGFGKEPQSPVDQAILGAAQIASAVRTGGAVFKGFRRGGKAAE